MKKLFLMLSFAAIGMIVIADTPLKLKSVTAQQRYPWNGLVDIAVTFEGSADDVAEVTCSFTATNCATGAAIPIMGVIQNGSAIGSEETWVRRFVWNASKDIGAVKIGDIVLNVIVADLGVQLWENGPYWADCNVGATKPEEFGYYFWWGDTVGYKRNTGNDRWVSVKDGVEFSFTSMNCPTCDKEASQLYSEGYIDTTGSLASSYDAATAYLGAPWRMPTDVEYSELISNCNTTWTELNGVSGWLIAGKGAFSSKSIFASPA